MKDPELVNQMTAKSWRMWVLPAILLVGLILRVMYLGERSDFPDFHQPVGIAAYHHYWAASMVSGDWMVPEGLPDPEISGHPYVVPPGYPWLLAAAYQLANPSPWTGRVVQLFLGLINILLVYRLASRISGEVVGWLAAGAMALSWHMVFFEQELVGATLVITLLLQAFLVAGKLSEEVTLGRLIRFGAWLGLAALVRPNLLLFVLVAAVWLGWVIRASGKICIKPVAIFLLSFVCVTLPATLRNGLSSGEWFWVSADCGVHLYLGNNPAANGITPVAEDVPVWSPFLYPSLVQALSQSEGRTLTYREASSRYADRATAFWKEEPGQAIALTLAKARYFWAANEMGQDSMIALARHESRLLRNLPFPYALSVAAFLLGIVVWRRNPSGAGMPGALAGGLPRRLPVLLLLFVVAYAVSLLPFVSTSRLRLPVMPVLFVFGAIAAAEIDRLYQRDGLPRAGLWLGALLVLWVGLSLNVAPSAIPPGQRLVEQGLTHARAGDWVSAEQAFAEAIKVQPQNAAAWYQLGNVQLRQGRFDEAARSFDQAVALVPDYAPAQLGQGKVLAQKRQFDEAADLFTAVLEANPSLAEGWLLLGAARQAQGRLQESGWSYQKAIHLAPEIPEAHVGLGFVFLAQKQWGEAEAAFMRALELQPGMPEATDGLRRLNTVRARAPR
ncbi:MAG: tetratricopeptide repeat protein [Verrucomicrobia bacterium]|nr:tetratricopeptide repeat protein [Verrucomicrobiota bacterium]